MRLAPLVAPLALALAACTTPSAERMTEKRASCGSGFGSTIVDPSYLAPPNQPRLAPSSRCDGWARSNRIAIDNRHNLATPRGESMLP